MKHEDLKVGMKVRRKEMYAYPGGWEACSGNVVTVKDWDHKFFSVEEEEKYPGTRWNPEYFEPVEDIKEKETMQDTTKNLITMDKKYKTRCGYPVRVLCVDREGGFPVLFLYKLQNSEYAASADAFGKVKLKLTDFDLIEVSPYEDFKKDDKVMVSSCGAVWYKRYFSHEMDGVPYAFNDGTTSWGNEYGATSWNYCRKPTQEELGE